MTTSRRCWPTRWDRRRRRSTRWSRPMRCSPTAASGCEPTLVDRVQDRYGRTVYKHDQRICDDCNQITLAAGPGAAHHFQPRAGDGPGHRLSAHLDDEGRRGARHRAQLRQPAACRRRARPAPPTMPRTSGSSASPPTSWRAATSAIDQPRSLGSSASGGGMCGPVFQRFMTRGRAEIWRRPSSACPRAASSSTSTASPARG